MSTTATAPAAGAVRVDRLSRVYGERWVLREISLRLEVGETLAVIGPNGAGKSTLLRILAGLLRATEGKASVLGCSLPRDAWKLRGRLGYLGHSPLLYRDLSAVENLRFHARLFGLGERSEHRIDELLGRVSLGHRRSTLVGDMSAGMTQRLAICRAVLHQPELLVLDEPLANLDLAGAEAVAPLLGSAPARTRVLVTHDLVAALAEADRVLAIRRDGTVAFEGEAAALDPEVARAVYADPSGALV